jgi:hypothetical protein
MLMDNVDATPMLRVSALRTELVAVTMTVSAPNLPLSLELSDASPFLPYSTQRMSYA